MFDLLADQAFANADLPAIPRAQHLAASRREELLRCGVRACLYRQSTDAGTSGPLRLMHARFEPDYVLVDKVDEPWYPSGQMLDRTQRRHRI